MDNGSGLSPAVALSGDASAPGGSGSTTAEGAPYTDPHRIRAAAFERAFFNGLPPSKQAAVLKAPAPLSSAQLQHQQQLHASARMEKPKVAPPPPPPLPPPMPQVQQADAGTGGIASQLSGSTFSTSAASEFEFMGGSVWDDVAHKVGAPGKGVPPHDSALGDLYLTLNGAVGGSRRK